MAEQADSVQTDMSSFLEVRGLQKSYGRDAVLSGLDADVAKAETLSVLGRSGCGKTTLLKIIAGLETADKGGLLLNGQSILDRPAQDRGVVYLYQEPLLFPHLTVWENVAFGLRIRKFESTEISSRVDHLLNRLGLTSHAGKHPDHLSGGQKQRVSFGRAIIVNPPLLLLDEPFGNLDIEVRSDMQKLFKSLTSEFQTTSIFVTHDLKEAILMGDSIATMADGQLHRYATLEEFVNDPTTGVGEERSFWTELGER